MECNMAENKETCACTAECDRRGLCCECLRNHLAKESLPVCMRKLDWLEVKS